jgi:hypothetical protein
MFGLEDAMSVKPRSYECRCSSQTGVLIEIEKEGFFKQINTEETWQYLNRIA